MTTFHTVCQTDDVPQGSSRMFVVDQSPVAIFNLEGEFFALRNECPHAGASLAHGQIEGDIVRCRIHHWGFCIRDGRYVDEDQPRYDAVTLPVRIEDDQVQVAVEPRD